MHAWKTWLGVLFGVTLLSVVAMAQTPPMLVKCARKDGFEKTGRSRYTPSGSYYYETSVDTTLYEITVINASRENLKDIKVTWALLIKTLDTANPMRIVEGERLCSLSPAQRFTFETDTIEVNSVRSSGFPTRLTRAEIQGYSVEVVVQDRVAASDSQPVNAKQRIDQVRAAQKATKEGEPPQKRHEF